MRSSPYPHAGFSGVDGCCEGRGTCASRYCWAAVACCCWRGCCGGCCCEDCCCDCECTGLASGGSELVRASAVTFSAS